MRPIGGVSPDQTRKLVHLTMLPTASEIHGDTRWIIRVLDVQGQERSDATALP